VDSVKNGIKRAVDHVKDAVKHAWDKARDFINSKFGQILLTIASYIPFPPVAMAARVVLSLNAAYEGIKQGNWLQAVSGIAGAVVGPAQALAGTATSGIAASVAKTASFVANTADKAATVMNAIENRDMGALLSMGAGLTGRAASWIGTGAEQVAKYAERVKEWSDTVLIGKDVVEKIKAGDYWGAITGSTQLSTRLGDQTGLDFFDSVTNRLTQVQNQTQPLFQIAEQGSALLTGIRNGDLLATAQALSGLSDQTGSQLLRNLADHTTLLSDQVSSWSERADQIKQWVQTGQAFHQALNRGQLTEALSHLGQLGGQIQQTDSLRTLGSAISQSEAQISGLIRDLQDQYSPLTTELNRIQQGVSTAEQLLAALQRADISGASLQAEQLSRQLGEINHQVPMLDSLISTIDSMGGALNQTQHQLEVLREQMRAFEPELISSF
jgi:hypothetical protein